MAGKRKDSTFKTVIISNRNPEVETASGFVGSNMVVIDGKPNIKHYRFQLDKEISLPEICIDQLKNRSTVGKGKDGTIVSLPLYIVEYVGA